MASLEKESLLAITLDSFDRNFNAAEGELELNGVRYDVKDFAISGDKVTCHVLRDEAETKLTRSMSRYNGQKEKGDVKIRFWFPHFFEPFRQYHLVAFSPACRTDHLSWHAPYLPAAHRKVLSPPPESA
jgi:hypothetical protein